MFQNSVGSIFQTELVGSLSIRCLLMFSLFAANLALLFGVGSLVNLKMDLFILLPQMTLKRKSAPNKIR